MNSNDSGSPTTESLPKDVASAERRRRSAIMLMFAAVGIAVGVGVFTFDYAEGTSYLSSNSESCANCHIMQKHYDAWQRSSHHAVAQCNDCHSDPTSAYTKLKCKAVNGFAHSLAFTTGDFPEPIQITDWNRAATEKACRNCHSSMVHQIDLPSLTNTGETMSCTRCHSNVGHPHD